MFTNKLNFKENNKKYILLFIFYSISHIWIFLILDSLFWDDWSIYNANPQVIKNMFSMYGTPIIGYLHIFLLKIGPPIYKLLTFLIFFINGILLDKILKRNEFISENNRFFICLLFLVSPFNIARVTLICFPYTFCSFLFFLAWYLLPNKRFISLILFLFSFTTNSLLVFYCLPIIEIFYTHYKFNKNNILKFIKRNLFFIISPFIFYFIKIYFFNPKGIYEGYNSNFEIKNLLTTPLLQINDLIEFKSAYILLIPIIVLFLSYIFYKYIPIKENLEDYYHFKKILLFGLLSTFCALFPYWILNHTPAFTDWNSRHQLLMPLGISVLITAILSRYEIKSRRILLSLFITIFLIINLTNYLSLVNDFAKQNQIIKIISNSRDLDDSNIVIFQDQTVNAFDRVYRNNEWQGILNKSLPEKNLIGVNSFNKINYLNDVFKNQCQIYGGIKIDNLPKNLKISTIKISYAQNNNFNFIAKVISKIRSFGYKPIKIQIEQDSNIYKLEEVNSEGNQTIKCIK